MMSDPKLLSEVLSNVLSEVSRETYSNTATVSLLHLPTGQRVSCSKYSSRMKNERDCWSQLMTLFDLADSDCKCPKCGSNNVWVGAFPLSCNACGWHHLNAHPCTVCGKPSFSACSGSGFSYYGCKDHRITDEIRNKCIEGFAKAVLRSKDAEAIKEGPSV